MTYEQGQILYRRFLYLFEQIHQEGRIARISFPQHDLVSVATDGRDNIGRFSLDIYSYHEDESQAWNHFLYTSAKFDMERSYKDALERLKFIDQFLMP